MSFPRTKKEYISCLPILLAIIFCFLAFLENVRVTGYFDWPPESDFYRDMGSAEVIAGGEFFTDPHYHGEYRWYNPLTPGIVGIIHNSTGIPLHFLYTRIGPFLNILGPIMLFILIYSLVDAWTALASLTAYLFLNNFEYASWFYATYSPWLFPCEFTQGLFFLTLFVYFKGLQKYSWKKDLVTGFLLGLTFLSHSAPALILALCFSILAFRRSFRNPISEEIKRLGVIGLTSFLVSLPFLWPLLFIYRGKTVNLIPSSFAAIGGQGLWDLWVEPRLIFSSLGLAALFLSWFKLRKGKKDQNYIIFLELIVTLTTVVAALLSYGLIAQELNWRRIVPAFHFHIYAKICEVIFFGLGLVYYSNLLGSFRGEWGLFAKRLLVLPAKLRTSNLLYVSIFLLFLAGLIFIKQKDYRTYLGRYLYDDTALAANKNQHLIKLYNWVRHNTETNQVFLSDTETSLYGIGPAGRKVVCIRGIFSHPYVNYEDRRKDCSRMYQLLREANYQEFFQLSKQYKVDFVILNEKPHHSDCRISKSVRQEILRSPFFRKCFQSGPYIVVRISKSPG